jgi:signal transduction histidine kinase
MKARLLVLLPLLLSFALPAIGAVAVSFQAYQRLWRDAARDAEALLNLLDDHAGKVLETQELVLDMLEDMLRGADPAMAAAPQTSLRLGAIDARLEQTIWLSVTDRDGRVVASSLRGQIGTDVSGADYFRALRVAPATGFIGAPEFEPVSKRPAFAMARRRPSETGDFAGTIEIGISPLYFETYFRGALREAVGAATLFRRDGTILARHPTTRLDQRFDPESELMRAVAERPRGGRVSAVSSVDGVERITFFRALAPYDVYVSVGVDLPERLARWRAEAATYAMMALAAAMLLASASWLTWRSLVARADAVAALQKEAERLHEAEGALQRARTLEALGRMARGVAHDVNNLLTVVVGHLELLADAVRGTSAQFAAEHAMRAAQAGARLAASLLAYARTQVLRIETVQMEPLLRGAVPTLEATMGRAHRLRLDLAPNLPACRLDAVQFATALTNLVANARDASPAGSVVAISASEVVLEAADLTDNPLAGPGRFVAVAVRDDGSGMDPAVLARVFEPFFTTKPEGSGAGLGLSQAQGVMQQLGGHVAIESAQGQGTTVTLFVPVAPEDEAHPAPPPAAAPAPATALGRILVVDDQPEIRTLARTILGRAGYEVQVAASGEAALAMLAADAGYGLVLSDVVMPGGLDGVGLVRRMREAFPAVRVLLMSGYTSDAATLAELKVGVLPKPFTRQALLDAVRQALAG